MPSEHGPVRQLTERAIATAQEYEDCLHQYDWERIPEYAVATAGLAAIRAAADALDAQPVAWPQGDEAAEALARAMYDVVEDRDEPTYRDEIFLVVQQWPLNYRRRLAAAVLARLHAGAQGVGDGD
jgi:hypothetical protein